MSAHSNFNVFMSLISLIGNDYFGINIENGRMLRHLHSE